jgi:hypothetical protein
MSWPDKPPWVVEAQAFIDREWARHLHDTVHVQDRDWRLPEGLARVLWGTKRPGLCGCRYCTTAAFLQDERDLMHICKHCYVDSTQIAQDPDFRQQLAEAASAALNDPSGAPWAIVPVMIAPDREDHDRDRYRR